MLRSIPSLAGSNIYELNVRQYTAAGTFQALKPHLPRLRSMGIDILWFMPITPISLKERKGSLGSYYAAGDYTSINPEFGTMEDFVSLVDAAHQLGFKVIIDWVANHTGWDHTWTRSHPEYYVRNQQGSFYEKNGWEDVIDLDHQNPLMQDAMIDAMKYWVEKAGIDGFRCDMAMLVPLEFWIKARGTLDGIRPLIWLAECEDQRYFEAFDMLYAWEWMHLTRSVAHGGHRSSLEGLWAKYKQYTVDHKRQLFFTSNHDENSWNGTEYERYGALAKSFAALSILIPIGIPLIYAGQELPLMHRLKFFDKDCIPFDDGEMALHSFYQCLLLLRANNPIFSSMAQDQDWAINTLTEDDQVFTMHLGKGKHHEVIVLMNLSAENKEINLNNKKLGDRYKNVFTQQEFYPNTAQYMILSGAGINVYERSDTH